MKKSLIKYPFLTREVEIYERDNGHKIVLAHKEGGMVNISSWVKTGSINENDKNNGISHFLEHLMLKVLINIRLVNLIKYLKQEALL